LLSLRWWRWPRYLRWLFVSLYPTSFKKIERLALAMGLAAFLLAVNGVKQEQNIKTK